MTELVGRTLANYTILEVIGQGGMATVYRAQDLRDRHVVAIKVLSPYVAADPKFRGRFDREVTLLRRLEHPNIVPILAFGQADGFHYIVMPYVSSGTLHERLRAGPLLPLEGGRIVEQITSALDFAHQQGVIHRDIKPSNILLDESGNALLTDFGFAHVPWDSVSLTGSLLIGTPAYMSPEQCRGADVGQASDQYSLGVVLYQLCAGRLPYEADTPMGVVIKQASQPLPAPRLANPNLPYTIEEVLIKVLAKEPGERYESVAALNQAFQGALKASLDPSGTYRLRQLRAEQPTESLSRAVVLRGWARESTRRVRRFAPLLAAVFLLGCPAAAWGFGVLPPLLGNDPVSVSAASASEDLLATIQSLSTQNAPGEGTVMAPGAVETAVSGTVAAMGIPEGGLTTLTEQAVAASTDAPTLGATPSPSRAPFGYRTRTPVPTSSGGGQLTLLPGESSPTPTPTPTGALPTSPGGPTATNTQAWTNTPMPSTAVPPTAVPPTAVPPTAVPPTAVPPTAVPPTAVPPTTVPPTAVPPTAVPPTDKPTKEPKCNHGQPCTPTPG